MGKRLVIIGGVAGGASAAAKARRTREDIDVVLVESGPYVSFANCGLPYYVGGEIPKRESLFVASAEQFRTRFGIDVRLRTTCTAVDRENGTVTLVGPDGQASELAYDRLVLATGTHAVRPPIPGLDAPNVFTVRTVPDVDAIVEHLSKVGPADVDQTAVSVEDGDVARALVVGGGYIGVETAEQLRHRGLNVTLLEMMPQLMTPLDAEMAAPVKAALEQAGCEVILGDALAEVVGENGTTVAVTKSGRRLPFAVAVQAVGVRPNVDLAREAGLELGETGAIAVDGFQRTSDPSVYAAGDNCQTHHAVLDRPVNIPLAGPANKAGRVAGANAALDLCQAGDDDPRRLRMPSVLGTSIVRAGNLAAAATGITERQAATEGRPHKVVYLPAMHHVGYYPGGKMLIVKIIYCPETGRLLGAQAVGPEGADKRIDVLATAITGGMTVEDLETLDLAYCPQFGSAKDLQILAGFAASNQRRGIMPTLTPAEALDKLAAGEPLCVLDVRTRAEWDAWHLDQAMHIPIDELRDRLDEVPADRPVAVSCGSGYRSYLGVRMLMNAGRDDVSNVTGGAMLTKHTLAARAAETPPE